MTWTAAGVALLVAITAGGCPPRPAAPAAGPPTELAAAVRGTIEQWRQAYEVRSMDALAKRYAHEPGLAIVQDGTLLLGWTAIEPALRGRLERASEIRVRIKDLQIAALGAGAAVAVGAMTRESTEGATSVRETGVVTLVLREDPDGWVIASEHYSYRRP
jgi:ketosteroid isomerase-like protein